MKRNGPLPKLPPWPRQPTPSNILIGFISAFFVRMFLADSNGDIAHARLTAIKTMNAYRIQHQTDLIYVAQIVASGFTTLPPAASAAP